MYKVLLIVFLWCCLFDRSDSFLGKLGNLKKRIQEVTNPISKASHNLRNILKKSLEITTELQNLKRLTNGKVKNSSGVKSDKVKPDLATSNGVKDDKVKPDLATSSGVKDDKVKQDQATSSGVKDDKVKQDQATSNSVKNDTVKTKTKSVKIVKVEKESGSTNKKKKKNKKVKPNQATSSGGNLVQVIIMPKPIFPKVIAGKTIKIRPGLKPVLGCGSVDTCF